MPRLGIETTELVEAVGLPQVTVQIREPIVLMAPPLLQEVVEPIEVVLQEEVRQTTVQVEVQEVINLRGEPYREQAVIPGLEAVPGVQALTEARVEAREVVAVIEAQAEVVEVQVASEAQAEVAEVQAVSEAPEVEDPQRAGLREAEVEEEEDKLLSNFIT